MTRPEAVMQREAIAPPAAASPHGRVEREREGAATLPTIALLVLVKFPARALPWGLSRLVLGTRGLRAAPGLRFARVLGSGRDGGFGLAPGFDHQGFIGFFDHAAQAQSFAEQSPLVRGYREHALESLTVLMRATSSRGSWGGVGLAVTAPPHADRQVPPSSPLSLPPAPKADPPGGGPIAAITRASIRLRHAARFWRHAPATHEGIARAEGCRLAIGLGEAPLLRQATFSLWDSAGAMEAYARGGAHLAAARGAWAEGWFSESMFVRLVPLAIDGCWHGRRFSAPAHGRAEGADAEGEPT